MMVKFTVPLPLI